MNARSRLGLSGFLAFASLAGAPSLALADPVVDISYQCASIVPDAIVYEGGSWSGAMVSVTGHSAAHRGYALRLVVRATDGGPLPDAWRYDPGGCQDADRFDLSYDPIVEIVRPASCVPFHRYSSHGPATEVVTYDPVSGELRIDFRFEYQPPSLPADPTWWYGLLRIHFSHEGSRVETASDPSTCGGLERAVCLSLVDARWIDPAGIEHPWTIGNGTITAHIAGVPPGTCGAVPARAATWGAIKGSYR